MSAVETRASTGSARTGEGTTAIDAERAFAADARTLGQWTAFRKWAAPDAIMFTPQPVKAQELLKDAKDPPRVIAWQPGASFVSCDGRSAVNTGPWQRPDGKTGYFSTVWVQQAGGGWRWTVDGGDTLATPRRADASPVVRRANCGKRPFEMLVAQTAGVPSARGTSPDGSLVWHWEVQPDGARSFTTWLWNGSDYEVVIGDKIAAPPPRSQ